MTFEEWWLKLKPAECDELKEVFEECWTMAYSSGYGDCLAHNTPEQAATDLLSGINKGLDGEGLLAFARRSQKQ